MRVSVGRDRNTCQRGYIINQEGGGEMEKENINVLYCSTWTFGGSPQWPKDPQRSHTQQIPSLPNCCTQLQGWTCNVWVLQTQSSHGELPLVFPFWLQSLGLLLLGLGRFPIGAMLFLSMAVFMSFFWLVLFISQVLFIFWILILS